MIRRHHLWRAAPAALWPAAAAGTKRIAVIATEYRLDSHADVIARRLMKGCEYTRATAANQPCKWFRCIRTRFPHNDLSRGLAAKYGCTIYPTVRQALTLGGDPLAVDSAVLIGEYGKYPDNERDRSSIRDICCKS